jgi:hypothetical protein
MANWKTSYEAGETKVNVTEVGCDNGRLMEMTLDSALWRSSVLGVLSLRVTSVSNKVLVSCLRDECFGN